MRYHQTSKGKIPFTAEEEAQTDATEAAFNLQDALLTKEAKQAKAVARSKALTILRGQRPPLTTVASLQEELDLVKVALGLG